MHAYPAPMIRSLTALALLAPMVPSQFKEPVEVLHTFVGEAAGDQFGWVARSAGDVDGDGVLDALISAPTNRSAGPAAGAVYVYSGKTGKRLHRITGDPGERLGNAVASVGDMDGDGQADFVCGAPAPRGNGKAYVFSGKDGSRLIRRTGQKRGDKFGHKVAGCGDVDGDGTPDFMVGAPAHDGAGKDAGAVYLFSGRKGKLLARWDGERAGDMFGSTVAGVTHSGDVWLAFGARNAGKSRGGRVYVYRGWPAEKAFTIEADETGVDLGRMFLGFLGDVDKDGVPDVYASDWSNGAKGKSTGRVYVHSCATGKELYQWTGENPGDGFGIGPGTVGDVDGDGHDDVIVGAWQNRDGAPSGGKVYLYSGKRGDLLRTITCQRKNDTFGFDAVGLGDTNGDGAVDYLITSAWSDVKGKRTGRVFIISGKVPAVRAAGK